MADDKQANQSVVIEQVIDVPPDVVWRMWTDPAEFARWYGPEGATTTVAAMEVRVGGARLVNMTMDTPAGTMQMWFTGQYREIVELKRLAYTESISDERGNILAPADIGMPPDHPTTTEVILELEDLGGRTRIVLTHIGISPDSPGAAGWKMALAKLATYISSRQAD